MRLRPAQALLACAALLCALASGCASSGFYQDAFQGTRGAVDALRRSGPEVIDPNAVQELTEAASRGVRDGLELPADLDAYAAALARHAVAGAVLGVADGLNGGLSVAALTTVDQLTVRLAGDGHRRGLAGAVIADATPGIERLTASELQILRRELAAMLLDTRRTLSGTTLDLNANLQTALRANSDVLSQELERQIVPALSRGMTRDMAPAVEALSQHAMLGATRGLETGLRNGLSPALIDLRENLVHGSRQTQHTIWALTALVIVLVTGITTIALLAARSARRLLRNVVSGRPQRRVRPAVAKFRSRKVRASGGVS